MSFLDKVTALLPLGKKQEALECFFALNISSEKLTAALWTIKGKQLKILDTATAGYSSLDDLTQLTDKLLDEVLGIQQLEPQKILFGVPSSWLVDENLKDEYLKMLRGLVKELELTPMAYVENARALAHFLEKQEGVPTTAILVGFERHHLTVTVVRAGKLDGVKIVQRGENSGSNIEKALLTFTDVETLPSKILIYGEDVAGLKDQLLSHSWMSQLSFLHFPKIEVLDMEIEIKSICLAGASEINEDVYFDQQTYQTVKKDEAFSKRTIEELDEKPKVVEKDPEEDIGFVVGDIRAPDTSLEVPATAVEQAPEKRFTLKLPFPLKNFTSITAIGTAVALLIILLIISALYLLLPTAEVKIFVEPKIVEKDTQVTADPKQKQVNEDAKIIPGQSVETQVSGSSKDTASGKKQIGDPAKGTVVVYNKTSESKNISKGTTLAAANGLKFTLDISVSIASQSASDSGITYGKVNATVTASTVGADSNLPSGSELTVGNLPSSQSVAKAEGNFSGGTSKEVTVVSDTDQKRLLASLASDLRKQAQRELQEKLPTKKILEEALSEEIIKKSFSKNINDQAAEVSLNLTVKYKGTAFEDKDLKLIVSKLVTTQVPPGFQLNLEDTETQADVSKLEKDGKLIFLARFKAKLLPKIDTEKVKNQIKGKSAASAINIIKDMENVLGAEIKTSPSLPLSVLQRLPIMSKNIKIEIGLK